MCSTSSIPCSSAGLFSPALLASLDPRAAFLTGGGGGGGAGGGIGGVLDDRRDSPSPRGSHGSRESPGHARDTDTPNSTSDDTKGKAAHDGLVAWSGVWLAVWFDVLFSQFVLGAVLITCLFSCLLGCFLALVT